MQQLFVAETQFLHALSLFQESPFTGHFSIDTTYHRGQERFLWPGMKLEVRNWVHSCAQCLRKKGTSQKHRPTLTTWQPTHTFWQESLNVMGPLPVLEACKDILLIGDQFSKWYESIRLFNQEAQTVARTLVEMWISRFGRPVNLHSDKGKTSFPSSSVNFFGF